MHRDIDTVQQKLLLDLAGEQALAADFAQSAILHTVAGGLDHTDFKGFYGQIKGPHQPVTGFMGLCKRQRGTTGADAQRNGWRGHIKCHRAQA